MKDTRFLLPQSEMRVRSEVKRSAASCLESCKVDLLSKEVEKCKVESSAYEWIGEFVTERSLMNKRKRVGDRTEPCGTPLLIGLGEEQ